MLINNAINKTKTLSISLISVVFLLFLSFGLNFFLGVTLFTIKDKTTTIILPFDPNSKYVLNNDKYNQNFIRDMGLSFVVLRLNNTPETVHKKHQLLLSYVDSSSRPEISAILSDEEKIIIKDDISSAFYYDEINIYTEHNVIEIKGLLKTWSGSRSLRDQNKTYQIKLDYVNGKFNILNFIEVKND